MSRSFIGFGFGPIQSGLFALEAFRSGAFDRIVIAEVDAAIVEAVRAADGRVAVNVARLDGIETVRIEGVRLLDPRVPSDRAALVEAVADADEAATALPSVAFYRKGVASVLHEGLMRRRRAEPLIVYAAENHNHAAEALSDELHQLGTPARSRFECLNTVIGKMSGVIDDPATIRALTLEPMTPGSHRAVLVEAFNRILISAIQSPAARCGFPSFEQKSDLLPFEEAKLYGHNAIHALIGYLSAAAGLTVMAEAAGRDDIMATARDAFLHESGAALCRRHGPLHDPLFTAKGFRAHALDLLTRMTNPHLHDQVARVIRDPRRKLGYSDRIFGAMRLVLAEGIEPQRMARGAAAAVAHLLGRAPASRDELDATLRAIWDEGATDAAEAERLIDLTWRAGGGG